MPALTSIHSLVVLTTILCFVNTASIRAGDQSPSSDRGRFSVNDLAWLTGRWVGQSANNSMEDYWSEPQAGLMMGMYKMVNSDGKIVVLEFETIQEIDGRVEFRFRHFNAKLEPWEETKEPLILHLVELSESKAVFVDPTPEKKKKNQPHRLVWQRLDPNTLASQVYVLREGKEVKILDTVSLRVEGKPKAAASSFSGAAVAGCATCIFGMPDVSGCVLAIDIGGKHYLVDGSAIDDHGDAHAADGLCKTDRPATVEGVIKDGRFLARRFELVP